MYNFDTSRSVAVALRAPTGAGKSTWGPIGPDTDRDRGVEPGIRVIGRYHGPYAAICRESNGSARTGPYRS